MPELATAPHVTCRGPEAPPPASIAVSDLLVVLSFRINGLSHVFWSTTFNLSRLLGYPSCA